MVGGETVGKEWDKKAGYTVVDDEEVIVDDMRTETRLSGQQLRNENHGISGMSVIS